MKRYFDIGLIVLATAATARASDYDLFHPAPSDQLESMRPDRPSRSDSPYTVEPGHLQIESGLVDYAYQSQDDVTAHQLRIMSTEFRVGLIDRLEFDAFVDPFVWQRVDADGFGSDDNTGFGDIQVGLKYTVMDTTSKEQPDTGGFVAALEPFILLPTATGGVGAGGWAGGVGVPMEYVIPRSKFSVDDTPTLAIVPDLAGGDDGPHVQVSNAITLNYQQTQRLSEFVEFFASVTSESGAQWIGTVDLGAAYDLGHNWQIDGGVFIGVSHDAPDVEFTVGVSKRL